MSELRIGAASGAVSLLDDLEMAGYAERDGPAVGTHDPLSARVVRFRDGERELILVVVDILYVPRLLANDIRREFERRWSIAGDAVMVLATHTHSGPANAATGAGEPIRRAVITSVLTAAERADSCVPARLVLVRRSVPGVSANRRSRDGDADPTMTVLAAIATSGRVVTTIAHFACHATVLGPTWRQWSADFPGVLTRILDETVGGVGVFVPGCGGDVNPIQRASTWSECHRVGAALGYTAVGAVHEAIGAASGVHVLSPTWETGFAASPARVLDGPLSCALTEVAVRPMRPQENPRWQRSALSSFRWVRELLADDLFGAFDTATPTVPVRVFWFGEHAALVGLPGEPFTTTSKRIVAQASGDVFVAGYGDPAIGYLPPASAWDVGGYEVGATLYDQNTEKRMMAEAVRLLRN